MVMGTEEHCRELLNAAIGCFRLGMEGLGNEHLIGFIDAIQLVSSRFPSENIQRINPILNEVVLAQARKDYLFVADLLEYGNIVPADPSSWVVGMLEENDR